MVIEIHKVTNNTNFEPEDNVIKKHKHIDMSLERDREIGVKLYKDKNYIPDMHTLIYSSFYKHLVNEKNLEESNWNEINRIASHRYKDYLYIRDNLANKLNKQEVKGFKSELTSIFPDVYDLDKDGLTVENAVKGFILSRQPVDKVAEFKDQAKELARKSLNTLHNVNPLLKKVKVYDEQGFYTYRKPFKEGLFNSWGH